MSELQHHGVLGMKWGVHKAISKSSSNVKLEKRALRNDKKSAHFYKLSQREHARKDLEESNNAAARSARYAKKSAQLKKRSINKTDEFSKTMLEKRAARYSYMSVKQKNKSERIARTKGYGTEANALAIKSDNYKLKAERCRKRIAYNKAYIETMKRKVSRIPQSEIENGYRFVERLKDIK